MTTLNEAREAVYARWVQQWDPSVPFAFANEEFDDTEINSPWARVMVRQREGGQETLGRVGNRKFSRPAEVVVQVFVPVNTGTQQSDLLVQQAREIFEAINFDGLRFTNGQVREQPAEKKWQMTLVVISFEYTEVK